MFNLLLMVPEAMGNWNSTQSSLVNSIDAGPLLMIVVLIMAVVGLVLVITSLERYTRLLDAIAKWLHSFVYTLYGIGLAAAGYGLYIACKFITAVGSGIDPIWIAEAIGVYIGLTILGWIGSKVAGKIKGMHALYLESKAIAPEVSNDAGT